MSMNRFVGLGIFALSVSVLSTLAACDDSTTASPGVGGAVGQGGGATTTTPDQGGGSSTTTASTGNGGSSTTTNTGNGGSSTTTPASTGCDASTNLIALADASDTHNWIGGDNKVATDNPCGVQGAVYAYSDKGVDNTDGGADASVQTPVLDDTTTAADDFKSPCSGGKCCIKGKTNAWPKKDGANDYTASVWGGGLGVSLGDPGEGAAKTSYAGSVKGFKVKLSGSLNGQAVRLGYTQSATDGCAPFIQKTALDEYELPFTGSIACPTWTCDPKCIAPTATVFDLQVQVVGGDIAGDFEVCIDSITPML